MKNKHPHAAVVLVLGLAMAGLHLADLLLWSEADTGFAAAGSVWLRYIPWLAAFALPYLPARRAAAQPAGLQDTNKPLGVCMALAGAVLLASGVAAGNTARYAILYPGGTLRELPGLGRVGGPAAADLCRRVAAELRHAGVQRLRSAAPKTGQLAAGGRCAAGVSVAAHLAVPVCARVALPYALHAAGAERCRRTAAGCGADQNFFLCRVCPAGIRSTRRGRVRSCSAPDWSCPRPCLRPPAVC